MDAKKVLTASIGKHHGHHYYLFYGGRKDIPDGEVGSELRKIADFQFAVLPVASSAVRYNMGRVGSNGRG
jgi:hypothetical protein